MNQPEPILPRQLTGPRSYFTDIDRKDQSYDRCEVIRKLKLQLLTKKNIVIAASSLFHEVGFELFSSDRGLTRALQEGVFLPAIQEKFKGVENFFDATLADGYRSTACRYFVSNTKHYVPWSLSENTKWFQQVFFDNMSNNRSLLRSRSSISESAASDLLAELSCIVDAKPVGQRFLSRDDISRVASGMGDENAAYLNNFGHLIYRISGARVVNSEGHFPQSNLINLGFAGNERQLADAQIFWELYVEAVISHITSAARLSQDRLDSLSFEDVLKVREGLFDVAFAETFDSLMKMAKADVDLHDPNRLIMTQEEISAVSARLATALRERVGMELGIKNDRSNNLLQLGSVVELFTGGIVFGTVGALKAIPEITSIASPKLADAISSRVSIVKRCIASKTGWDQKQKKALISGYTSLLTYGLPENA